MAMSNGTYDKLKWVAQYGLPAVGTLYFGLAQVLNLPNATEVVGAITAIDTFLGVMLGVSTSSYSGDGTLKIDTSSSDKDVYRLELNIPVEDLAKQASVLFKVDTDANLAASEDSAK
jgi:hypothetical protein